MEGAQTQETQGRTTAWRGVAVLAAMLVASGSIAPAFGAVLTKRKATAIVKKQIKKAGAAAFIEESELMRFSASLNAGQSAFLTAIGPFTLIARCDEVDSNGDGPPLEERGRILIHTSEDNTAFESDEDSDDDFDSGAFGEWADAIASAPGAQEINDEDDDDAHAAAASGTRIAATSNRIVLNEGGVDCSFAGSVLVLP